MAGRIWNDATYAVGRGLSDAIGLASNGPTPARYTLRVAAAIVAAPVAVVGAMEAGPAVITATTTQVLTNPQGTIDFINSIFPATAPAPSFAGADGTAVGFIFKTDEW